MAAQKTECRGKDAERLDRSGDGAKKLNFTGPPVDHTDSLAGASGAIILCPCAPTCGRLGVVPVSRKRRVVERSQRKLAGRIRSSHKMNV